jgi:K+-transporting ATPase ATPase C chain
MFSLIRSALVVFALLSVIVGIVYPFTTFAVAQVAFPHQANGSMVVRDGKPVGSALIGQAFDAPGYFHGRPSATSPEPYNAMASGGSNLGPSNPALRDAVKHRLAALHTANPDATGPVPSGLVLASASGLDPDLSPQAAEWQASRIARAHGLSLTAVRVLITRHTQPPSLGLFGEPRINVLALNLALDDVQRDGADNLRR